MRCDKVYDGMRWDAMGCDGMRRDGIPDSMNWRDVTLTDRYHPVLMVQTATHYTSPILL